jgi:gamma-glutamyltranspeptidase/glutathione hydrolase
VGVNILKAGGNAFDAAVATAFAIHVAEPNASGLGGGGFAILYDAKKKKSFVIDFRERAPAAAHETFYQLDENGKVKNSATTIGWYAAGVPGQLAGMEALHKRFATKKWKDLITPAIKLLEAGVPVDATLHTVITNQLGRIEKSPTKAFFDKHFLDDGLPLAEGSKYTNPDLVASLKLVAKEGAKAFYSGAIADKIVAAYEKHGNKWITKQDLADYKVIMRKPVSATYRKNYTIEALPPPSSGGLTVIELLNIVEKYNLKKQGVNDPRTVHAVIEAQKLAFADRGKYMGDPDFVQVPVKDLLSKKFAAARAKSINPDKSIEGAEPGALLKDLKGNTTSFSIIDKDGNMITVTQTINDFFGSVAVPEGTGIILNDEMDDFSVKPGRANSVQAGKRPLSSMSPVLVFKGGKPFMTMGSPGGPRIITAIANIIMNVVDHGMGLQDAIAAPRYHNPNSAKTAMEARWSAELQKALTAKGQQLDMRKDVDLYFGGAQGVMILPGGKLHGGADFRRGGKALGY